MKGKKNMRKLGFTLAEVLITLVIIGVIAAMTIPTLLGNTNAQEFRTALKKAISASNQALTLQYALEGVGAGDFSTADELVKGVFAKRMSLIAGSATIVQGQAGLQTVTFTNGCSGGAVFVTQDGLMYCVETSFAGASNGTTDPTAIGKCDAFDEEPCTSSSNTPNMLIDVNGAKGPNKLTTSSAKPRDIYQAMIYNQKIVPYNQATQEVMYDKPAATSGSN